MKVVYKPIQVVAWFDDCGGINPLRFKVMEEEEMVIKVDRIDTFGIENLAGNLIKYFDCTSEINGVLKKYQIRYELKTCKWILFKI